MNKTYKSMLIALTIGDGCIRKIIDNRDKNNQYISYYIIFTHCEKQKDYLQWKSEILNSILGGKQNEIKKINNGGYVGYTYRKGNNKLLKPIYNLLYKNNKKIISENVLKHLTPEGIAIWYMDDGCLYAHKRNGKIHGYEMKISTCFNTKEEAIPLVKFFKENYDVQFRINAEHKKYYSLVCSTKEIRKFMKVVKPYVEKIPCMQYKILND